MPLCFIKCIKLDHSALSWQYCQMADNTTWTSLLNVIFGEAKTVNHSSTYVHAGT